MNSLSKGMCVIVGSVMMLWTGTQLLKEESRPDHRSPSVQRPEHDKTLSILQQELATLRHRLAHVEHSQPNVARLHDRLTQLEDGQQGLHAEFNAVLSQDIALAHGEEMDSSVVESAVSGNEHRQKLQVLIEEQFSRESDDPTWSRQTEASLTQAITGAAFDGSRLLAVGCRTSLCQMEISHENESAQEGFITDFPFTLPFDTEVFYQHLEGIEGTASTVMYMARTGRRLPMPDQ